MIVIGYPGIGKSTTAKKNSKFIDLESSNFWVDGHRHDDWYRSYCQVAEDLSRQGYIVFVSYHREVRQQLESSPEHIVLVFPSLDLEDAWVKRLRNRYEESNSFKDYKAWQNSSNYAANINELERCGIGYKIRLRDMNYDLEKFFATQD